MKLPKTTGDLIRHYRVAKGQRIRDAMIADGVPAGSLKKPEHIYSQADLAEDCGTSASAISAWERGEKQPQVASIRKLAGALEVPVSDLLGE